LDTSQQMRLQQKLILAPRMIQSMEILQLPIMELQERIQQELQENPTLELKESRVEEPAAEAPAAEENPDREPELVVDAEHDYQLDFDRLEAMGKDWGDSFNEEHRPSRAGQSEEGDKKQDAMQNMPSRPQSLHEHLIDQVNLLDIPERIAGLAQQIITN